MTAISRLKIQTKAWHKRPKKEAEGTTLERNQAAWSPVGKFGLFFCRIRCV